MRQPFTARIRSGWASSSRLDGGDPVPAAYRVMHRRARVTVEERDALARGLMKTLAASSPGEPREGRP